MKNKRSRLCNSHSEHVGCVVLFFFRTASDSSHKLVKFNAEAQSTLRIAEDV